MWAEIIKKIELQSVLVLTITLVVGLVLLEKDNSLSTPAGALGSVLIVFGLIYTFGSFFSNQIRESYKDVIEENKKTIETLRSSNRSIQSGWEQLANSSTDKKRVGESYSVSSTVSQSGTQVE